MITPTEIYIFQEGDDYGWSYKDESEDLHGVKYVREDQLNEIKAKAIEEALLEVSAIGSNGHDYDYDGADLKEYANKLRGE